MTGKVLPIVLLVVACALLVALALAIGVEPDEPDEW